MIFKSTSIPKPSLGKDFTKIPKITVPDQSLSLQEILERFTRGETQAIGNPVYYMDTQYDLEKVAKMDLVDKQAFIDEQKLVSKHWNQQEAKKAAQLKEQARQQAIAEAKAQLAADSAATAK